MVKNQIMYQLLVSSFVFKGWRQLRRKDLVHLTILIASCWGYEEAKILVFPIKRIGSDSFLLVPTEMGMKCGNREGPTPAGS